MGKRDAAVGGYEGDGRGGLRSEPGEKEKRTEGATFPGMSVACISGEKIRNHVSEIDRIGMHDPACGLARSHLAIPSRALSHPISLSLYISLLPTNLMPTLPVATPSPVSPFSLLSLLFPPCTVFVPG